MHERVPEGGRPRLERQNRQHCGAKGDRLTRDKNRGADAQRCYAARIAITAIGIPTTLGWGL
jgi:hypothetical protein